MAILKRVRQGTGDGAGRARYTLKRAVAVRTDIPSPLSLLTDNLTEELKGELANEFNRQLLLHQQNYKTQHFIVSFSHHLVKEEIEVVLDKLERIFDDPFRLHLFVVHQEKHGTAVHIVESGDPEGKLRHLNNKEFHDLKRRVIKELRPFLNERELQAAKNYEMGISTQDWKYEIEVHTPEWSFKEYIRQAVREASRLIEAGDLRGAIEFFESKGIKIVERKAGQLSPQGKRLKRDRLYAVFNHPQKGLIAVRLDKKMRATYQLYLNASEEYDREFERIREKIARIRKNIEGIERNLGEGESIRTEMSEERTGAPGEAEQLQQGLAGNRKVRETERDSERRNKEATQGRRGALYKEGGAPESKSGSREVEEREEKFRERDKQEESGIRKAEERKRRQGRGTSFFGFSGSGTEDEAGGPREKAKERTQEDSSSSFRFSLGEHGRELSPIYGTPTGRGEYKDFGAENRQTSERDQSLSAERDNATSSEELGSMEQRQRKSLLSAHSKQLSSSLPNRGNLEISNQTLRDVHSSFKFQSEVEMSISQEILEEIKQIPPEKVLNYLQIPYKQVGNQIMAQATWRDEKEASVSIQYKDGKWLWHDFGTGEGGDWIDLYRRYTGSDFKEAVATLMELANVPYSPNISTREPKIGRKKKTSSLSLAEFEELERIPLREFEKPPRDLERYLEEKGFLPYWEQIKEIPELYYLRYRRGNKEYSGLATRTTAGTWIIKNRYGTYVSRQPSGISIWNRDTSRIVIVEGFTDAMSLSLYPRFNNFTILILNGLGNLDKAIEILKILSPDELYIALDLDEKGLEGRKRLKGEFPEAQQVYFYGKDPAEHLERGMELPPLLSNELKRKDFKTLREYLNSNVLNSALNEFPEFKEAFEHAARWDPATYELYLRWLEEKPYGIYNKERERAVWMIDKVFEKHSKLEPKEFVKTVYLEIWKSALMDKLYPSGSYIDYERVERYADELLREIGFSGLVEKIKRVAWEKYEREIYPQIMKQYRSLEREREQGIDNSFSGPGLGG